MGSSLTLDPELSISEWADMYRFLPARGAAEAGRGRTSRTPYLKEIMDELSPSSGRQRIVMMKGAQLGGTECGNNLIGYHIHQAPAPIMMVQPSLSDAKKVSQQRIAPMIEATPVLRERVADPKARDSGNTVLMKLFTGGLLLMVGANSDKGLRSTPAQILFADEIDSYPDDVAGQGDPVVLAEKRCSTFPNRKTFLVSTPTIKDFSRIEREYLASDQRKYYLPCPHCKHMQTLRWANLHWDHDPAGNWIPDTVRYECENCGQAIDEMRYKTAMLEAGEWRPSNPASIIAGFHVHGLYSPIGLGKTWRELAIEWHAAQQDQSMLKAFINTVLGEVWEDAVTRFDENELMHRREDYENSIPLKVGVLTCGVDIQIDRIELELVGWGRGQESWHLNWLQFFGNPAEPSVWRLLDDFLLQRFEHDSGATLPVACTCIDTGGANTQDVYRYLKGKSRRRIFGVKGLSTPAKALTSRPTRSSTAKIPLVLVGTDTAKDSIYARLHIQTPGPGYSHFHNGCTLEYFAQLTAEVVETTHVKGHMRRRYIKAKHKRNEALDCRVYALAALDILKADLDRCCDRMIAHSKRPQKPATIAPATDTELVAKATLDTTEQDKLLAAESVQARRRKRKGATLVHRPKRPRRGWMRDL